MIEITGQARRDSRLQMQIAVNGSADDVAAALRRVFPELREREASFRWISPLAPDFEELRDEAFLRAIGLERLAPELGRFWPLRGPLWDGLAHIDFPAGPSGVLLAAALRYPEECYSTGARAKAPESRALALDAIAETQRWLGVELPPERWIDPVRPQGRASSLYQSANRFVHLYFLRELAGVDAWLVHVLFVDDTMRIAASRSRWEHALDQMEDELGLARARVPWSGHVYLPARTPPAEGLAREGEGRSHRVRALREQRGRIEMADLWTYRDEIKHGRAGVASEIEELDLDGFAVEARDGDVGKVDGAAYDDGASYVVVDTGPLFFGRKVLVPGSLVRTVDVVARVVTLDLDKERLENAPEVEEERLGDEAYRTEIGRHYEGTSSQG